MKYFFLPALLLLVPSISLAASDNPFTVHAGDDIQTFVGKTISFSSSVDNVPENESVKETLWDFGDGVRTTGDNVTHAYQKDGTYRVRVSVQTDTASAADELTVQVLQHVIVLLADTTAADDILQSQQEEALKQNTLLLVLRPKSGGPEVLTEEELTNELLDARDAVAQSSMLISWTSGSVGPNVWSKFAQHLRQNSELAPLLASFKQKAVAMVSETPFGVLTPIAQSAYDQLKPNYVLLTRPAALHLLITAQPIEDIKDAIFTSTVDHRLLGAFSTRTVNDLGPTNFISFGINSLVNRGVPINNITLLLMLPIIATILSFSRQVIGIKAFGIITPAMTTLSFLVMGLTNGLIVFSAVLLSGTITRLLVRKLHLLYLPRMALVLTSVSLAILLLLGVGASVDSASIVSFAIFPTLILTLLAEEFIAVQFTAGARTALTITAWTLGLSIACYFIMSWELFRTIIISYPEVALLAIPINILLGRWTGLRLTEYFRFRKLLRQGL
jgi:PKD repeat protein